MKNFKYENSYLKTLIPDSRNKYKIRKMKKNIFYVNFWGISFCVSRKTPNFAIGNLDSNQKNNQNGTKTY